MRIKEIEIKNNPPINYFQAVNLDNIVLIAGPNGIGKTRLIQRIIEFLRNAQVNPQTKIKIEATSKQEEQSWQGKKILTLDNQLDINLFRSTLQQNKKRRNFKSSILYFESNRQITQIQPLQFTWDYADPWEEDIGWDFSFSPLSNRFQDTLHSLFKKIQSQKSSIANRAIQLRESGHSSMNLNFSDPLDPFREAFFQLLSPKTLVGVNMQGNSLNVKTDAGNITEQSLSSGEREVLNITFDFLLRQPSDCIIFFDEPELHLHPELANKLLNTLKTIGKNNQFIFCTHSAELISSNLDNNVIFIQPATNEENQAVQISLEDETYEVLKTIGQSIGVISLGKKIVLIEGQKSSLDKKTYLQILKGRFPNLVLVPCEGKYTIHSFSNIANSVLSKTVWGVDFFLLSDRDACPEEIREKIEERNLNSKIKSLSKYHLENYFLDENIISKIFEDMEEPNSDLRNPEKVKEQLKSIAIERVSYSVSLSVSKLVRDSIGNIDIMPKSCHGLDNTNLFQKFDEKTTSENKRIFKFLNSNYIETKINEYFSSFNESLNSDKWKDEIPGKQILSIYTSQTGINEDRFKTLYIKKAFESKNNPFQEIINLFEEFSQ